MDHDTGHGQFIYCEWFITVALCFSERSNSETKLIQYDKSFNYKTLSLWRHNQ